MAITKVRGLQQIESGSIGGLQLTGSIANEGIKHVYGSGSDGHSGSLQLDTTFTPTFAGVSSSAGIDVGVTGALSESRFGGYVHIEGSLPMSQSDGTIRDIGLLVDSNISGSGIYADFLELSASVIQASGSNIFGDDPGDTHQFTGSVFIHSGSAIGTSTDPQLTVATASIEKITASELILGGLSYTAASAGTSGTTGTSGTDGSSGTTGSSGSSGTSGTTGSSGSSGTSGTTGSDGSSGTSGTSGSSGSSGTTGTSGSSGSSGTTGTSGSSGSSGTTGTSGVDAAAGIVQRTSTNVQFVNTGDTLDIPDSTIRAKELIAEKYTVSESIVSTVAIYSSGSNIFGDSGSDYHQFTGSVGVSGSLTIDGDLTAGNIIGDGATGKLTVHHITASGHVSASEMYIRSSSDGKYVHISGGVIYGDAGGLTNIPTDQLDVQAGIFAASGSGASTYQSTTQTNPIQITGSLIISGADQSINIGRGDGGSDYSDGLYPTITHETSVGTMIDRFNVVLKALAPAPAPNLRSIDDNVTSGVNGVLQFGASATVAGYSNVVGISGAGDANAGNAVDFNAAFNDGGIASDGSVRRHGIFNGNTSFVGQIQDDVGVSGYSYPNYAFGDGEKGTLSLFHSDGNNITLLKQIDLTSAVAGDHYNGNDSGFKGISAATAGVFSDGETTFPSFKYRTGEFSINKDDQNDGFNYIWIQHEIDLSTTHSSDYIEWVNDSNSDALDTSDSGMGRPIMGPGTQHISGIKYFTEGGSMTWSGSVSNAYKYTRETGNAITFATTRTTITACEADAPNAPSKTTGTSNTSIPVLTAGVNNQNDNISITASVSLSSTRMLYGTNAQNNSISVGVNVGHNTKADESDGGAKEYTSFLYNPDSEVTTATYETTTGQFKGEHFRLQSASIDWGLQTDPANQGWDETVSMNSILSQPYMSGLALWNQRLYTPSAAGNAGVFNTATFGPTTGQPDYQAAELAYTGERTYYRKFLNSTGTLFGFDITLKGSATWKSRVGGESLGTSNNNIYCEIKIPGKTAWLDTKAPFVSGDGVGDTGDKSVCAKGCYGGASFDASIDSNGATNAVNLGSVSIVGAEYFVLRIVADKTWSGYLTGIDITW